MFNADNVVRQLAQPGLPATSPTRAAQDAYFDAAARGIFDALLTRDVDPLKLLRQLGKSVGQRRFLVWSAHPDEQQQIAGHGGER